MASSAVGLVTNARTACLAKLLLSSSAIDLPWIWVIKIKKTVKKGRVKIKNSAMAEPFDLRFRDLIIK